jgi:hypothetical protein
MINSSTKFFFDNKWSDDASLPPILNVTLSNDMYQFNVIGEKTIIEDQIQGRDEPYLYNVDHKPLEFTINIAFENYETIDEVNKVVKWLYNPKTYKIFKTPPARMDYEQDTSPGAVGYGKTWYDADDDKYYVRNEANGGWVIIPKTPEYFVIFIGSPEYYYVGNQKLGYRNYIGYITCKMRVNAPYGYTEILTTTENTGDLETYPSFTMASHETSGRGIFRLVNTTNSTSFKYFFATNEVLTFNGYTKNLSTTTNDKNPYLAWDKNYVILNSGSNTVSITTVYGDSATPPDNPLDGETYRDTSDSNNIKSWNATLEVPAWQVVQYPIITYSYRAPKYL